MKTIQCLHPSVLVLLVGIFFVLVGSETTQSSSKSPGFSFGPASTAITPTTALVWLRADGPRRLQVEYSLKPDFSKSKLTSPISANAASDFTTIHRLAGLVPDREYFYRGVVFDGKTGGETLRGTAGRFRTTPKRLKSFSFAISGDMEAAYQPFKLFDRIAEKAPDFFIHLGDTIYADHPKQDFLGSLDQYRQKHRENRSDKHLESFLQKVPVYAIWDDHEVENDFDRSHADIPDGRKAFREYWPIQSDGETILYRRFSWTPAADFFILDTRQYRSGEEVQYRGGEKDPSEIDTSVTMLGNRQKQWLKDSLIDSTARFKFIFTSVIFLRGTHPDKWSGYKDERRELKRFIRRNDITGVVFFSSDTHFGAKHSGRRFKEYGAGPIATKKNCRHEKFFESKNLFFMCDSFNYILVKIIPDGKTLSAEVQFMDIDNKIRYRDVLISEEVILEEGNGGEAPTLWKVLP